MWDRPRAMFAAADLLFAMAALLLAYATVHWIVHLPVFPLREITIRGELEHVTREQVKIIVKRELKGNFFTLDLSQARRGFEKLPWVRSVSVRRRWPDGLEVKLEEHVALARWGSQALVNSYGEIFEGASDSDLPVFNGPPGSSREIAQHYAAFRRALAPLAQDPVRVNLSPRRAWQLRLGDGMVIELGREQVESRLERFVAVYDRSVGRLNRRLDYVDLRYPNGFAVRIPGLKFEKLESKDRKAGERKAA